MVFPVVMRAFSLQTVKLTAARIPSIKFRKGSQAASHQQASGSTSTAQQAGGARATRTIIVDELPARFRRTPISEEEMECINSGGAR